MSNRRIKQRKVDMDKLARFLVLTREVSQYSLTEISEAMGRSKSRGSEIASKYEIKIVKK